MGTLKIDRAFLRGVPERPEATAMLSAILHLARALGRTVVVEGVETEAQEAFLRAEGSPLAQGFLLGRPMPAELLETRALLAVSPRVSVDVVVRHGPRVERHAAATLPAALALLEREARAIAAAPLRRTVDLRVRSFAPVEQVAARVELRGRRAGVDVRGDGSVEAWTGGWRRRVVAQRDGESPYEALRRVLA